MKVDYILRGGRVIDPSAGVDAVQDVYISGRCIVSEDNDCSSAQITDAHGCIVTPGLIDYHAHVFYSGSNIAIRPDLLLQQGTTTVVDAGTAGCANYEALERDVIRTAQIKIRSFLNIDSRGQEDAARPENFDPAMYDRERMEAVIGRYMPQILGLKLRLSRGIVPEEQAAEILLACVELANWLEKRTEKHLRLCVHATDCPLPAGDLAAMLRPGDIFCHCFQGKGNSILTSDGGIDPGILTARERGVLFDAANGRSNFSLDVARRALDAGFLPDIISSDLTVFTFEGSPHVRSLPHVMSKYLALGLGLPEVVRRCTENPARLLGKEGEIGTLRPGARADIAVFRLTEQVWEQEDYCGDRIRCEKLLVPRMTFLNGKPV